MSEPRYRVELPLGGREIQAGLQTTTKGTLKCQPQNESTYLLATLGTQQTRKFVSFNNVTQPI